MSEYLEFIEVHDASKTKIYTVHAGDSRLGVIKWHDPLRQYVLFAGMGTVWNSECLNSVITFINGLTVTRAAVTKCPSGVHTYTVMKNMLNARCHNCGKPYNEFDVPSDPPQAEPDTWESMG